MTRRSAIFLDSFCGAIAELRPGQRTEANALRALAKDPRVSTFERGPAWLESLLRGLVADGLVIEDKTEPYPWHRFNITAAGRARLTAG